MDHDHAQARLLEIIADLTEGRYSNDVMELTRPETPEPFRTIAEALGLLMVRVEAREFHLHQLNERIKANAVKTVSTMAHALAARDHYTQGHAHRVAGTALALAQRMGLAEPEVEAVHLGGILHDIGKIGFPDVLFAEHDGKNPPELVKRILKHPQTGAEILADLDFLGPALEFVRCHHERLDGSGYPRRLKAEAIPLGAQIIAVADSYDAITTDRPYQQGQTPAAAVAILAGLAAKGRLNPAVVQALAEELGLKGSIPA